MIASYEIILIVLHCSFEVSIGKLAIAKNHISFYTHTLSY